MKKIPYKRRHPTQGKDDFTVERHGRIVLIRPNTRRDIAFANKNIGADSGYQPYWPTMIFEPHYAEDVIKGIRGLGLMAR